MIKNDVYKGSGHTSSCRNLLGNIGNPLISLIHAAHKPAKMWTEYFQNRFLKLLLSYFTLSIRELKTKHVSYCTAFRNIAGSYNPDRDIFTVFSYQSGRNLRRFESTYCLYFQGRRLSVVTKSNYARRFQSLDTQLPYRLTSLPPLTLGIVLLSSNWVQLCSKSIRRESYARGVVWMFSSA